MRYAIVQNGKVDNIVIADSAIESSWLPISDESAVSIGWLHDGESFSAPTGRNKVKIAGLMRNGVNPVALSSRVLISQGESLGVTARFENSAGDLLPLTDTFGMPIYQLGGIVDQTIAVNFIDGTAQLFVTFDKSGEYVVTADGINLHLPDEQKLDFESFYISVLR